MDQKRLILAIAVSLVIIIGWQALLPKPVRPPVTTAQTELSQKPPAPAATIGASPTDTGSTPVPEPKEVPRVKIQAPRVEGSISLVGARIDDVVLRDYRETLEKDSPLVRLLEPRGQAEPYYAQFGWVPAAGDTTKVPDNTTLWQASGGPLGLDSPVTLTWDNGAGAVFEVQVSIDPDYMFNVRQTVRNTSDKPVSLYPWSRIRRDYKPATLGYSVLHEGLIGQVDGHIKDQTYDAVKSAGEKANGIGFSANTTASWAGITDKYWLTALVPDRAATTTLEFVHTTGNPSPTGDGFQVGYRLQAPQTVAPGAEQSSATKLFAGAKEVRLLDRYESKDDIKLFSYAVDWGWFFFITKPFFYAIDTLNSAIGNFGVAIMVFTLCVKLLFFPLANKSYKSMSKMKLLGPKMTALREQYKDDPAKLQQQMMQLYKTEKVNPASGCLPMVVQIPVFFSLYKVIIITIEMRHAPFFGWIQDLSVIDPTNIFNLFGLVPWDPTTVSPLLHLGVWPLIMGATMYFQQKLNPPPPDPVQARLFQFMPLVFMFMMARFPAGLVIYWSWNNTLTIAQQSYIMRNTRLERPANARITGPAKPPEDAVARARSAVMRLFANRPAKQPRS